MSQTVMTRTPEAILDECVSSSTEAPVAAPSETMTPAESGTSGNSATPPSVEDYLASLGEFNLFDPPQSASSSYGSSAIPDIPAEFFTPTAADLKYAQTTLQNRARTLQEAPLLTQRLRQEREQQRLKRWPNTTIRIKFADRTMLEKAFPSSSKIKSVYTFVRNCLREDVRVHKFVLFTTPPPTDLRVSDPNVRDKSLLDLQLAPSSVLMFRFLEEDVKLDVPSARPPLTETVLSRGVQLPPPPQLDNPSPVITGASANAITTNKGVEKKLPKWLKLGKK